MPPVTDDKKLAISQAQQCLGFILAGGRSSRMGTDKATVSVAGRSMLHTARDVMSQTQVHHHVVVGGRFADVHENAEGLGPGRAICELIMKSYSLCIESDDYQTKRNDVKGYALFIPVDMPFLQPNTLTTLIQLAQQYQRAYFYEQYYLPLVVPISASNSMILSELVMQKPSPSVRNVINAVNASAAKYSGDEKEFANINSPAELAEVLTAIS
jgi:molybdopterin-guanine dinucleotide biosynthesis protein A